MRTSFYGLCRQRQRAVRFRLDVAAQVEARAEQLYAGVGHIKARPRRDADADRGGAAADAVHDVAVGVGGVEF